MRGGSQTHTHTFKPQCQFHTDTSVLHADLLNPGLMAKPDNYFLHACLFLCVFHSFHPWTFAPCHYQFCPLLLVSVSRVLFMFYLLLLFSIDYSSSPFLSVFLWHQLLFHFFPLLSVMRIQAGCSDRWKPKMHMLRVTSSLCCFKDDFFLKHESLPK